MKWATALGLATLMATMVNPVAARPAPKLDTPRWVCGEIQHREFDTYMDNLKLDVQLCVQRHSDGKIQARAEIYWSDGGGLEVAGMKHLILRLSVEHRNKVKYSEGIPLHIRTNHEENGNYIVHTASFNDRSKSKGGWTADGVIKWDINSDGKKGGTWELTGSPAIR
jgi:hypothetical protein